jgi:hypothetical protein
LPRREDKRRRRRRPSGDAAAVPAHAWFVDVVVRLLRQIENAADRTRRRGEPAVDIELPLVGLW